MCQGVVSCACHPKITHTDIYTSFLTWLQVMSPMRKGPAGVNQLNTSLQALLNPPAPNKAEMPFGPPSMLDGDATVPAIVRTGDRVIQNTNNYQKDVFNGDIGFVAGIKKAEREVLVRFPGKLVWEPLVAWVMHCDPVIRNITASYCVQGSSCNHASCIMFRRIILARPHIAAPTGNQA